MLYVAEDNNSYLLRSILKNINFVSFMSFTKIKIAFCTFFTSFLFFNSISFFTNFFSCTLPLEIPQFTIQRLNQRPLAFQSIELLVVHAQNSNYLFLIRQMEGFFFPFWLCILGYQRWAGSQINLRISESKIGLVLAWVGVSIDDQKRPIFFSSGWERERADR